MFHLLIVTTIFSGAGEPVAVRTNIEDGFTTIDRCNAAGAAYATLSPSNPLVRVSTSCTRVN